MKDILNDEDLLDTEYIDEYQSLCDDVEIDEESFLTENDASDNFDTFDELKLKKSRYTSLEGKSRFLRSECAKKYEFSRTPITFYIEKTQDNFTGIVLKELDHSHFIMLVDDPNHPTGKKMKKVDISDISIYF